MSVVDALWFGSTMCPLLHLTIDKFQQLVSMNCNEEVLHLSIHCISEDYNPDGKKLSQKHYAGIKKSAGGTIFKGYAFNEFGVSQQVSVGAPLLELEDSCIESCPCHVVFGGSPSFSCSLKNESFPTIHQLLISNVANSFIQNNTSDSFQAITHHRKPQPDLPAVWE
eukprot:scaffold50834_cov66-Attheya_sp.AAC.1